MRHVRLRNPSSETMDFSAPAALAIDSEVLNRAFVAAEQENVTKRNESSRADDSSLDAQSISAEVNNSMTFGTVERCNRLRHEPSMRGGGNES